MQCRPWSSHHSIGCRFFKSMAFSAFAPVLGGMSAAAPPATSPAAGFHDQVVSEYLDGKWEKLESDLAATKPLPG